MSVVRQLHQAGDTIVEVMIVLAILGLAIGISYATANRSLLNSRQAQENTEATYYVQQQIELLRYNASTVTDPTVASSIFSQPSGPFCMNTSGANVGKPVAGGCNHTIPYVIKDYNCANGVAAACPSGSPANIFVVQATWPDVLGQGNDTVTMTYRLYPSS